MHKFWCALHCSPPPPRSLRWWCVNFCDFFRDFICEWWKRLRRKSFVNHVWFCQLTFLLHMDSWGWTPASRGTRREGQTQRDRNNKRKSGLNCCIMLVSYLYSFKSKLCPRSSSWSVLSVSLVGPCLWCLFVSITWKNVEIWSRSKCCSLQFNQSRETRQGTGDKWFSACSIDHSYNDLWPDAVSGENEKRQREKVKNTWGKRRKTKRGRKTGKHQKHRKRSQGWSIREKREMEEENQDLDSIHPKQQSFLLWFFGREKRDLLLMSRDKKWDWTHVHFIPFLLTLILAVLLYQE